MNKLEIKSRSFWVNILLSVVTLGIYGLFYGYYLINAIASIRDDKEVKSEFWKLLGLNIITLGLYQFYWYYKISKTNIVLKNDVNYTFPIFGTFAIGYIIMIIANALLKASGGASPLASILSLVSIVVATYPVYIMQKMVNTYVNENN